MPLTIGVLKETASEESRVALTPEIASKFKDLGAELVVQSGAGEASHYPDEAYAAARLADNTVEVLEAADVLLKVQSPALPELDSLREGAVVIGFMQAHRRLDAVRKLCERKITSFAVELIPRISRAQSMDALSS